MKVLIVGSGGREHALAWKLTQSPELDQLFIAPGNVGTASLGENVAIGASDLSGLARFAKQNHVDLTVIGPDDALAMGVVDLFQEQGLRIFGPNKSAARLESSKIFAKELMRTANIPTARAQTFYDATAAHWYCGQTQFPIVIKADGLALGKGVVIAPNETSARSTIDVMMKERKFGEAGLRVLIEECLTGVECSLHALVDGEHFRLLQTARDHKRAFDRDQGPNTGGMGAFSPADIWTNELEDHFENAIMRPLLESMRTHGISFRGLLFPGLMITSDGPRVLEFNCRFGDPETQAILPRMKSDLLPLLNATIDGKIDNCTIEWDERASVTVVLASGGYPDRYEVGKTISGLAEAASLSDVHVFHAGTKRAGESIVTAGGRVLAVTALGRDVPAARQRAYEAVALIQFEGVHFRRDIAASAASR